MKMDENWRDYRPDFPGESWTEGERTMLAPFATNLDGHVSVVRNLPPEIVGALCSRASRATGSLLRVLYDEYFKPILEGEDKSLAKELQETVSFLTKHGFKNIVNNQRAQKFYAKWLSQYGDDSIAQLTGTHVVFPYLSQVGMKFVEDQRLGLEPIEKSTRYVDFGKKVGGSYLYYTPKPDLARLGLLDEYRKTMDRLFDVYVELLSELKSRLKEMHLKNDPSLTDSVIEKKAFDTLRGLLPMATVGQVAFRGNAQAFEYLINRTAAQTLGEFRWIARALKNELDQEIPSLLLRVNDEKSEQYQSYLAGRAKKVRDLMKRTAPELLQPGTPPPAPTVELIDHDKDGTEKVVAAILFEQGEASKKLCLEHAKRMNQAEKRNVVAGYLDGRTARWQKVGRAFENAMVEFEIMMDVGAYRDLHRHRILTQERQKFTIDHGYDVPAEITDAGLERRYRAALESVRPLFEKLKADSPELAQYVVPMAHRVRFYQKKTLRQCFWEMELRTISQGHPNYRAIEQEKFRQLQKVYPLIAQFMLVDMNDYPFARRGVEESIAKKEEKIVKGLQSKQNK